MLFLEVVSVLCFGQGSYEPPTPELIEVLMKRIFQEQQVTQDLTPLAWEETDSNPVVRSVLLQLILMGRCADLGCLGILDITFTCMQGTSLLRQN